MRHWLNRCGLVAILRGVRPEESEAIAEALLGEGVLIVEVPLNSPDPLRSIERIAARFGDRMLVGAGTVRTMQQVRDVAAAGGLLLVTPHADAGLVREAKRLGMFACPGGFTPTEFFALIDAGADAVKLFPAEAATPSVLRSLRAVLPKEMLVLPVGGMAPDNLAVWKAAGADGFGIGSSIFKPGDTPDIVSRKARALVDALAAA